jgi:hypothetical protein
MSFARADARVGAGNESDAECCHLQKNRRGFRGKTLA